MKDEHVERAWTIRDADYYGGTLTLEMRAYLPYPGVIPRLVLVWTAYEGGGVEINLDYEEGDALATALREATPQVAVALRDQLLAAYRLAEDLGAPS